MPAAALRVGEAAPAFSLQTTSGKTVTLSELRGKTVVLYFYPKDDTPGCTKEACSFQAHRAPVAKAGAVVLGISGDGVASHERFAAKFGLTFPLLSDPDFAVCKAYGVYKQKSLYGRTYWGIERTTFLIDECGRIARIFPKVRVDGHTEEVLAALHPPSPEATGSARGSRRRGWLRSGSAPRADQQVPRALPVGLHDVPSDQSSRPASAAARR